MERHDSYVYTGLCAFGLLRMEAHESTPQTIYLTGIGGPIVGVPRLPMLFSWAGSKDPVVGTAATALFSNRDQEYRKRHLSDAGERTDWVWIRPELTADAVAAHDPRAALDHDQPFDSMAGPVPSRTLVRLRQLVGSVASAEESHSIAYDEAAVTIVGELIDARFTESTNRRRRASTQRAHAHAANAAAELIATDYAASLTLERVARVACMSPLHFCRVFRERTGATVHQYLTRVRLAAALERLADDGETITRAAHACGFCSSAHLSDAFRRATGLRPSSAKEAVIAGVPARLRSIPG